MRPRHGRARTHLVTPTRTPEERDMTHHTKPHRRRPGARGLTAIIAAFVLALALAACGDDDDSSSGSSSTTSSSSSSSGSGDSGGVAKAQSQLEPYQKAPTEITITEPLKAA